MKVLKPIMLLSLFSTVLWTSCITVQRIDKKDSKSNEFSIQLQDWMAVKHPQRIDTSSKKTTSDTTITIIDSSYYESDSTVYGDNKPIFATISADIIEANHPGLDSTKWIIYNIHKHDSVYLPDINDSTFIGTGYGHPALIGGAATTLPTNGYLYRTMNTIVKHELRTIIKTIHDTTMITVVNTSEVKGLQAYLQTSRDSTNQYILKYTQQKSTSRGRLIWIITMGIVLAASGYFNIKNAFKL